MISLIYVINAALILREGTEFKFKYRDIPFKVKSPL